MHVIQNNTLILYTSINAKSMHTVTIQVDNPSILSSLKKILNALEGVTIVKSGKIASAQKHDITQTAGYQEAMQDKEAGRTYHAESVDDMFKQILG